MQKKTIILTRPQTTDNQLSCLLEEHGFMVLPFPTIEIAFLQPTFHFETLESYSHIVFTSVNGVQGFFQLCGTTKLPKSIIIVCIGKKTAQSLEQYGYSAEIVAKGNTAEDLAQELRDQYLNNNSSLLLSVGKKAGTVIEDTLSALCKTTRLEVYDTIQPTYVTKETLVAIKNEAFSMLVFTSPSTFKNFITITAMTPQQLKGKIACIGKTTALKVIEQGYEPSLISPSPDAQIFAKEISNYCFQA